MPVRLTVLEATFIVHVIRPFSSYKPTEIVSAQRVYAFDTGFVCYYRGWHELRNEDLGHLWEHFVLNEIHAHVQSRKILYWRDKRGHEIDFVLSTNKNPVAIECKWSASDFNPVNVIAFRRQYPEGKNFVVANDVERSFSRTYYDIVIRFVNLKGMIAAIT